MRTVPRTSGTFLLLAAVVFVAAGPATARTIELTHEDIDRAAAISEAAPRASWAGWRRYQSVYSAAYLLLTPSSAGLVRYDLSAIPKDMRITKAEWFIPVDDVDSYEERLSVWRMLVPWGVGVCHDYRAVEPEKLAWDRPGGRGPGTDRALRRSEQVTVTEEGDLVINVTSDVAMWHSGVVPNEGWMLTVEDRGARLRLFSPLVKGYWRLRVTYEPK